MKNRLKSFLKYVIFSSFFSTVGVASPIASPGTSTIYNGVNSSLLYSPTVNGNGITCGTIHYLVNEHVQGWYSKTVNLSPFTQCSKAMLIIKAAGGKGGFHGGFGGITILQIPLQKIINYYGSKVTFYYAVGGAGNKPSTNGYYGYGGGGGGGESLVSLINWPWYNGVPLAIGGGGGGGSWRGDNWWWWWGWWWSPSYSGWVGGGGGGGGNDPGQNGSGYWWWWWGGQGGGNGNGGNGVWWGGGNGGNGWWGYGGNGGGGGGGGGYGGGGGGHGDNYWGTIGGGGGGGYCNTSLGSCQASDWTNGGGNPGNGYVEIYVESNE